MKKLIVCLLAVLMLALCAVASADPVVLNLSDNGVTGAGSGVTFDASVLTITMPGEYILSGSLSNGSIVVNSPNEGKITLYLNGVTVHNETGAAIMITKASPRVTISLMEGTVSTLSGGASYTFEKDDEPNAVIFSRSDLTITGEGTLNVTAATLDGIASKDDLRIKSGTINVEAARNGIRGKDCVEIQGGTLSIVCNKDGIRSSNDKTNEKGYVSIADATLTIVCGSDPIHAETGITVENAVIKSTIMAERKAALAE